MKEILLAITILAHSWYPPHCCSGEGENPDCRPVPCHEVTQEGDVLVYKGKKGHLSVKSPSKDEYCHICTSPTNIRCFFYVVPAT